MKARHLLIAGIMAFVPAAAYAVSSNSQGPENGATSTNSNSASVVSREASNSNDGINQVQDQSQSRTQLQTNNPQAGTMTQDQIEQQARIEASTPKYTPANSKAAEHKSIVANAVKALIESSYQMQNNGIGDQIRTIAQTQSQNQDKIGQSIDTADKRSGFAKFFIGSNYKELKVARIATEQNQLQIKELVTLMDQVENESDKVALANQVITLQDQQIKLKDQLNDLSSGFSLFGWIARWRNNY